MRTAFAHFATRLDAAGADGLVLFNRFYQPDFDLEELEVVPNLVLSDSHELRLRLHWTALLYNRIRPDLVVISAGPGNRYGHPHPEVLDYWQDRGVPVLRTDRQGEIRVRGFRGKLKVSTWLEPAV